MIKSIFSVFKRGFQKTSTAISRTIFAVFTDEKAWDKETYERIEVTLLQADFGFKTTQKLLTDLKDRYEHGLIKTDADIANTMGEDILKILGHQQSTLQLVEGLTVIVLVGVNGSGKTTTAGKLANLYKKGGKNVMLAACDTFRAAAVEQLTLWSERIGCSLISAKQGADPAAVAFDAVCSAIAKKMDLLIIDTAGRQQNKKSLMEELSKIVRVIQKQLPRAPHHVLLTLDASIGGNAVVQAKEFAATSGVTGLVLTKLDGTGRGGVVVAIHEQMGLPVHFVGLGEQAEDLQLFDPELYVKALFSQEGKY